MFWLIITILFIIGGFIAMPKDNDFGGSCFVFALIFGVLTMGFIAEGTTDYRCLIKHKALAQEYHANLNIDIKQSAHQNEKTLVDGRAEYIENYAKNKAEYNFYLKECNRVLESRWCFWFRERLFMHNKIKELEPLQ